MHGKKGEEGGRKGGRRKNSTMVVDSNGLEKQVKGEEKGWA
jgi:hypothetical protein